MKKIYAAAAIMMMFAVNVFLLPGDEIRRSILDAALQYQGVPYVYGAESPAGFDCSGFVRYVYRTAAGIDVPRTSKNIWALGLPLRVAAAQPGDILVFDTVGGVASHVAILLEDQRMIHAVSDGPSTGVIISPLQDRYFAPRIIGARTFIMAAAQIPPADASPDQTPPGNEYAKPRNPGTGTVPIGPEGPSAAEAAETPVDYIGLTITNRPMIETDRIPALMGTGLQFALTNGTGRDGSFEILFYKMDMDPSKQTTLRRDRIQIKAGSMAETEPFIFTEPGQYKLIVKTHDNMKRAERVWRVLEMKKPD
ncbi:C40 family peptidase [Treponema sp. OttesenSCG-928-L16]|nr:C40 family peptidase [Treponema sp. OttesenSCG-928-L16]